MSGQPIYLYMRSRAMATHSRDLRSCDVATGTQCLAPVMQNAQRGRPSRAELTAMGFTPAQVRVSEVSYKSKSQKDGLLSLLSLLESYYKSL